MSFAVRPIQLTDAIDDLSTRALSRLDIFTFAEFKKVNPSRRAVALTYGCGTGTLAQIEAWAAKHGAPLREELIECVHCRGTGKVRGF